MGLFKRKQVKLSADDSEESSGTQNNKFSPGDIDIDQVDIPLNEDLSEFLDNPLNFNAKVDTVDIDLTDYTDEKAEFDEARSLTVNPLKPFSNQVEMNLDKFADKGYITPAQANTPLSNAFRKIKRPIVNIARGKGSKETDHPNLIMVTSSKDGEGKSYTAINLAMSIAMEKDNRVLLIDADIPKPSHHQIFDIKARYGLTDLLQGKVKNMSEVLNKTNIPSLSLMFAGAPVNHATELLASRAMDDFILDISTRYPDRIIIFDSPPLLMTPEASVLAPHMGQVVVVVEAEATPRHMVDEGLKQISNDIVMLLLNKMLIKEDATGYGYYGQQQVERS